jgi:hypothetical protein
VFGRMGLTLLTANELANASNVAATIIMRAGVHPDFQMLSVSDDDLYRSASFQGSGLVRGLAGGCVCSCGGVHVASGLARGGLELPRRRRLSVTAPLLFSSSSPTSTGAHPTTAIANRSPAATLPPPPRRYARWRVWFSDRLFSCSPSLSLTLSVSLSLSLNLSLSPAQVAGAGGQGGPRGAGGHGGGVRARRGAGARAPRRHRPAGGGAAGGEPPSLPSPSLSLLSPSLSPTLCL